MKQLAAFGMVMMLAIWLGSRGLAAADDGAQSKPAEVPEGRAIGMRAPEITGTDADGKEIKLSQFRGNVVVIDFWGFW